MIEACDALDIIRTKLLNSEYKVPHFEVSADTAALMRKAG